MGHTGTGPYGSSDFGDRTGFCQRCVDKQREINCLRAELAAERAWGDTAQHRLAELYTLVQQVLNKIEDFRAHEEVEDFESAGGGEPPTTDSRTSWRSCARCQHWAATAGEYGKCRHNAPTVVKSDNHPSLYGAWPLTSPTDWCGNFSPRDTVRHSAPECESD